MSKATKLISLLLLLFLNNFIYPQKQDDLTVNVNPNFDIRKISSEYLGNPDLWPYILKYNNIKNLSDLTFGSILKIPKGKVNRLYLKLSEANNSFQKAVQIGSKILAEDPLSKASNSLQQAIKQKDLFDYESAEKSLDESIKYSGEAYRRTKEIREKTMDAIISFKKGDVQKMFPSVLKWEEAELYDNLKENDWARTLAFSNANITFYDLSQIKLNENSQAIIQSSKFDVIENKTTTKVKLEKGDAFAMLLNSPKKKFDLDIKGVKTKINSKYFWVEKGSKTTKLSNYNGEISLAVKDSSVVVKKNQGSVIPEDGFPAKPKNLLPFPSLITPEDLTKFTEVQPKFEWGKIKNAESYWMEISRESNFAKVYMAYKNIRDVQLQTSGIEAGVYYWHVCSVDSTGLPGPFSDSRIFVVKHDSNKPYLTVETPANNFITRTSKIFIKGKTLPDCNLSVNNIKTILDKNGNFEKEINLADGINKIEISSRNGAGLETKIYRTVFCEINPEVKLIDKINGEIKNSRSLQTSEPSLRLLLNTRPLSRLEFKLREGNWSTITYADTLGNCEINLRLDKPIQNYSVSINTPAGFEKNVEIGIRRINTVPRILFEPEIVNETNEEIIIISGRVENISELFINKQKVSIGADEFFSSKQILKEQTNNFEITGIAKDGNTLTLEKKVLFDDKPPLLRGYDLQKIDKDENYYRITVKADDFTQMKNYAEITLEENGRQRTEMIKYSKEKNIYEGIINCDEKIKPKIKKITLEDLLSNKKTYDAGK